MIDVSITSAWIDPNYDKNASGSNYYFGSTINIPSITDHGALSGLDDDDHSAIYYNKTYILDNFYTTAYIDASYYNKSYVDGSLNDKASIYGSPGNDELAVWTGATSIEGDSNLTWNGSQIYVGTDEVFNEGHEDWQTDTGGAATWDMGISRNFDWSMTGNAELTINNAENGSSGVLIISSNGSYTATLPANSTPASIAVTSASNVLAVFTKRNNGNYIWSYMNFLDPD